MFLIRRAAVRAISASPSKACLVQPRSITTLTPVVHRLRAQHWSTTSFQRRFASDETSTTEAAQAAAADSANFSQTAEEAPVEENLTPADPTNESETVGPDALEAAGTTDRLAQRVRNPTTPPAGASDKILYVGNLYFEVTPDQLKRIFSKFGEIESVKIISDNRGLSRGFGYVEYKNTSDAQAAIENLDMQVFEGRNLVVQFHTPKYRSGNQANDRSTPSPPSKTLFVGNMSFEMSDKDLNDLFRDIRNVLDVRVAIDRRTGQPRGFAHADFVDIASATRAREVLKDKVVYGRQLRVDFSRPGGTASRDSRQNSNQD